MAAARTAILDQAAETEQQPPPFPRPTPSPPHPPTPHPHTPLSRSSVLSCLIPAGRMTARYRAWFPLSRLQQWNITGRVSFQKRRHPPLYSTLLSDAGMQTQRLKSWQPSFQDWQSNKMGTSEPAMRAPVSRKKPTVGLSIT